MNEIERKFLVTKIPNLLMFSDSQIVQGYVCFSPEIRIRNNGNKYYLTCKSDGGLVRKESETEIDKYTFESLKMLVKENLIFKRRYKIPLENGLVAELDIYQGSLEGLSTVEIEFKDIETAEMFVLPNWFGEEITNDLKYKNKNLARLNDEYLKDLLNKSNNSKKKIK